MISISFWATYPYLHLFSLSQVILIGIGIYRSEKRKVSQRFLAWGLLIFPFWHLIHHFWQHLNFINLPDRHFMGFFALGGIIFFQNSRQHNLKYLLLFPLILSQSWAVYISSLIWALLNWRTWKLISSASCLIISALIFAYLIPQTGLQLPDFALIQTNLTSALKNLMLFPQGLGLGHFPLIWQNSPILLSPWEMEYQTNLYLFISNELGLLFFSFGIYYLYRYWKNFSLHLQKLFQFLLLSGSFYSIWVTDLRLLILISIMVYNFLITTPQNQLDKKGFSS
ncbi:MAG TPA: hypothetical protein PLQ36_03095 [Candidatus Gracilibacteria bacterium]|nr:hypothetical protein [Candidatus Gracilibacteria bacterium]